MIISPAKYYSYFRDNFVLKHTNTGWFLLDCPYCVHGMNKKKMAVQFHWEVIKCWVCGYKERIIDFVKEYENLSYVEAKKHLYAYKEGGVDLELLKALPTTAKSDVVLPEGFNSILEGEGMLGVRARNYLQGRNMDLELLDALGVGYVNKHSEDKKADYFGYIIIPFKKMGLLYYYIGRDYIGNFLRYKNPPLIEFGVGKDELLFNEDALELCDTVFLTEGWACAVTMGKGGIAMLGLNLSIRQRSKILKSSCTTIVVITDAGFYSEGLIIGAPFLDHKKVFVLDLNKLKQFGKDPNEIGRDKVMKLYEETPHLTIDEVIKHIM